MLKSLNTDHNESKSLVMFLLDDTALYTATMVELPILVRASRNFLKKPNKSVPFYTPSFYTNAKIFLPT